MPKYIHCSKCWKRSAETSKGNPVIIGRTESGVKYKCDICGHTWTSQSRYAKEAFRRLELKHKQAVSRRADELIGNIRLWQIAQAEYEPLQSDYDHIDFDRREAHREASHKLDEVSVKVTGHYINPSSTLKAFVALADEIERLRGDCV